MKYLVNEYFVLDSKSYIRNALSPIPQNELKKFIKSINKLTTNQKNDEYSFGSQMEEKEQTKDENTKNMFSIIDFDSRRKIENSLFDYTDKKSSTKKIESSVEKKYEFYIEILLMVIARDLEIKEDFQFDILKELSLIESCPRYESFRKAGVKVWTSFCLNLLKKKYSGKIFSSPSLDDEQMDFLNQEGVIDKIKKMIIMTPFDGVLKIMSITVPFGVAMILSYTHCCDILNENIGEKIDNI